MTPPCSCRVPTSMVTPPCSDGTPSPAGAALRCLGWAGRDRWLGTIRGSGQWRSHLSACGYGEELGAATAGARAGPVCHTVALGPSPAPCSAVELGSRVGAAPVTSHGSALLPDAGSAPPAALGAWRSDPAPVYDTIHVPLPYFATLCCASNMALQPMLPPAHLHAACRSPPVQLGDWDTADSQHLCSSPSTPWRSPLSCGHLCSSCAASLCCSQTLPAPSCHRTVQLRFREGSCVIL